MAITLFGLTGNFGSGKSSAAKIFRVNGIPIIDMAKILDSMFLPGSNIHRQVIEMFDEDVLNIDGTIDLMKISLMVCNHNWAKEFIDYVLAEEIEDFIQSISEKFPKYKLNTVGIEINNLIGNSISKYISKIILVHCDERIIKGRLLATGLQENMINSILEYEQPNNSMLLKNANIILDNCGTLDILEQQVLEIIKKL